MINAVIFDFDGVILDTETSMVAAWEKVYGEYEQVFPVERWLENIGTSDLFNPHAHLQDLTGQIIDRPALYERVRGFDREVLHQRGPMAGVTDRIAEARALGLKLAIASSSPANWLNFHLPRLGLLFEFEAVRACTDVDNRKKPDPAVFLAACEAVRVKPEEALALEDSLHGVRAAKAAGMKVVAVPNGVTRLMDLSEADLLIHSLEEMTLAQMIAAVDSWPGGHS